MIPAVTVFLSLELLGFCGWMAWRAYSHNNIDRRQAVWVFLLVGVLTGWAIVLHQMGVRGLHLDPLKEQIPFLWQACVPVALVAGFLLIGPARKGLVEAALAMPWHWLVWMQSLRVAALGSLMKWYSGDIESSYVPVVGIPDFLYGLSAIAVGWLVFRHKIGNRFLLGWSLLGAAIILIPTFGAMPYWMQEPGFEFIFAHPMVMAPGIVVPLLVLLNLLLAWAIVERTRRRRRAAAEEATLLNECFDMVKDVEGDYAEFGVFQGKTFLKIVEQAKSQGSIAHAYDSFRGMAEPDEIDQDPDDRYDYPAGKFDQGGPGKLKALLAKHDYDNFNIVAGFIPDSLDDDLDAEFCFGHIDLDHYWPTVHAAKWFYQRLKPGGVIVFDDYFLGRKYLATPAVDEFIEQNRAELTVGRIAGSKIYIQKH